MLYTAHLQCRILYTELSHQKALTSGLAATPCLTQPTLACCSAFFVCFNSASFLLLLFRHYPSAYCIQSTVHTHLLFAPSIDTLLTQSAMWIQLCMSFSRTYRFTRNSVLQWLHARPQKQVGFPPKSTLRPIACPHCSSAARDTQLVLLSSLYPCISLTLRMHMEISCHTTIAADTVNSAKYVASRSPTILTTMYASAQSLFAAPVALRLHPFRATTLQSISCTVPCTADQPMCPHIVSIVHTTDTPWPASAVRYLSFTRSCFRRYLPVISRSTV